MNPEFRKLAEYDEHEKITELNDPSTGLKGFIAIHNTNLGPALGGTRIYPYANRITALKDALKLSRAMTYKCAIAGMPFGGGKGVIIGNPKQKNIAAVLKSYALEVEKLNGEFYTGEDVGLSEEQVSYMSKHGRFFIGKTNLAGDPSPYAAQSAFLCIQLALKNIFKSAKISGRSFAVKGIGKTGRALAEMLIKAGGIVTIGDIDRARAAKFAKQNPSVKTIDPEAIQFLKTDVYSPCALGNDITINSAKKITARIVAGTANNQLSSPEVAKILYKKGILHIPDYIANAGGLINVANELMPGGYDRRKVLNGIQNLGLTLERVLTESSKKKKSPDEISDKLAEGIFKKSALFKNKAKLLITTAA